MIFDSGWSNGGFRSETEERMIWNSQSFCPSSAPSYSVPYAAPLPPSSSDVHCTRWAEEEGGSRGLHPPIDVSRGPWRHRPEQMAVSRWCRALSAAPDRRHSPALDDAGLDDEQVETPPRTRARVAVAPSPDGSHRRAVGTSAHPSARSRGESGPYRSGIWSHSWPTVDCQSRISRELDTRGATLATGHLELQRADDSCPAGRPVALSRRCLIFSARPRTDTRSRRTEPRRGCGWSPLPCLSVVQGPPPKYTGPKGGWDSLLAVWCHCRPLSAISHHQTLPNTVWRLMQAGLAAHIHNPHVLPPAAALRCWRALVGSPCPTLRDAVDRGEGCCCWERTWTPPPLPLWTDPGPWPSWLAALAVGSACPRLPCHARMESLSLIFDLFFCKTLSALNHRRHPHHDMRPPCRQLWFSNVRSF